jgi:hypothetical protein
MSLVLDRVEASAVETPFLDRPSMEEKVFDILKEHGMQTLHELDRFLPNPNWAQVVLAVDRLSRASRISVLWDGACNYLLFVRDERSSLVVEPANATVAASSG